MDALQQVKYVNVIAPAAVVDNASYSPSVVVDTAGYDHCTFVVALGTTDVAMTALKIQEADAITDANTLTSGADVTGLVYGTSTDPDSGSTSALPTDAKDNKVYAFHVSTKGRKRYLQLAATAGNGTTGTYLSALAILSKAGEGPYNATTRGLDSNLIA